MKDLVIFHQRCTPEGSRCPYHRSRSYREPTPERGPFGKTVLSGDAPRLPARYSRSRGTGYAGRGGGRRRRQKEVSMLKTLYALAIALLVVAFVGFGISAFYPEPEPPEYPPGPEFVGPEQPTEEEKRLMAEYREEEEAFRERLSD